MSYSPKNFRKPRENYLEEDVLFSQFTDGGGASGTFQLAGTIPVGAVVRTASVNVLAGFSGDTTAALIIGDGSDTDRYNTGTPSVLTAGHIEAGVPSGVKAHATAIRPTLTVTGASDFTLITAGKLRITIPFLEPRT